MALELVGENGKVYPECRGAGGSRGEGKVVVTHVNAVRESEVYRIIKRNGELARRERHGDTARGVEFNVTEERIEVAVKREESIDGQMERRKVEKKRKKKGKNRLLGLRRKKSYKISNDQNEEQEKLEKFVKVPCEQGRKNSDNRYTDDFN